MATLKNKFLFFTVGCIVQNHFSTWRRPCCVCNCNICLFKLKFLTMAQNRKRKVYSEMEEDVVKPKIRVKAVDDAEEEQLTKILFGGSTSFLKSLEEAEREEPKSYSSSPDSGIGVDEVDDAGTGGKRKVAWVDEDDEIDVGNALKIQGRSMIDGGVSAQKNSYKSFLEQKFESVVGKPRWAIEKTKKSDDVSDDSDDEMVRTCGFLKKPVKHNLPAGSLEFKSMKQLNVSTKNEGLVNSLEFHPKSTVALVAGTAGVASLFAVDGLNNHKLHSVAFEKFPIKCAAFTVDGNDALLGSHRSFIYNYDLLAAKAVRVYLPHGITQMKNFVMSPNSKVLAVAGKFGEINVLSVKSKERVGLLKQDSDATALSFNHNGDTLYGHSNTGEVTVFDMKTMRVRHKWTDVGCLEGSTIDTSSSNQFLATGSKEGVVNLYGTEDIYMNKNPKARKTNFNLRTSIDSLKFNPSSEILAFGSQDVENGMRLLHVGTGTVFHNFPQFGKDLGNISRFNFSPNGGYLAIGNTKSTVCLYRLKHYNSY